MITLGKSCLKISTMKLLKPGIRSLLKLIDCTTKPTDGAKGVNKTRRVRINFIKEITIKKGILNPFDLRATYEVQQPQVRL